MPKAVVRSHPAGGRALPWALLLPDEALSGALLPPDEALSGTLTPPDEALSGSGGVGGADAADGLCGGLCGGLCDGLCDGFCGRLCGWLSRMAFPGTSSGRGGARLALACGGQPMSFSSCRSEASGKSVRKWSRMRTNDSAGVQSAISGP